MKHYIDEKQLRYMEFVHQEAAVPRQSMAEEMHHISMMSYLSTLFKQEMGKSITEYILSKRMEAACSMLKFSDYSFAEIGAILTFSSQSHFSRVFKEQTGQTPREYRNAFLAPKRELVKT